MSSTDTGMVGSILSLNDAAEIGFKVVEMADRVKAVDPAVPGTQAKWSFGMDGVNFDVTVALSKQEGEGK